jgi:hypothetical protein
MAMPKYRNKIRLKKYIMKHWECDPLTEYLICKGFNDEIVGADWKYLFAHGIRKISVDFDLKNI